MKTDLLIIGAGPFGMAIAAQAQHDQIEHLIAGKAMEFWRRHMPKGMFLRSACDWHLDPQNVHTIEAYLQTQSFPVLDDHFETSLPGLFITSMLATQDFGPFFGFTISVRTSARLICERLLE